jgi:hypothetical protein
MTEPSPGFDRRERWLAALFFALVIVLAFPQVVFLGRSLVASEQMNPLDYRATAENYGPNFVLSEEWNTRAIKPWVNIHDPGSAWWQAEPGLHFFRNAILSGQFPFWDPSAGGGTPAYTNLTQSFLFPPQIALSLAGATSGQKNAYILLFFWASAFGTYCLLRMHGILPLASAAGGLLLLFSGAVQQIAPITFMAQVVVCMPFLIIVTRWFVNEPSWRRTAMLAATYAIAALASFPPILIGAFAFTVLYFCCVVVLEKRTAWRLLSVRYSSGVLLSLGLAAAYYLPTVITISHAEHVVAAYSNEGFKMLPPRGIFDLLSPTSGGGTVVYVTPIIPSYEGHLFYVGVTALLLAALGFGKFTRRVSALVAASALCAALILLKIFGLPPVQWIALLPFFQSIHYTQYFGILLAFLISLLAGIGFDRLLRHRVGIPTLAAATCLVAGMIGSLWLFARNSGALRQHGAWRWLADYRMLVLFAGIAIVAVLVLWLGQRTSWGRVGGWALLALIFAEGVVNATYPRQRRWDVFAHPPQYVSVLQQMQPRSRGFVVSALNANLGSAFGLEELDSLYTFFSLRMHELYMRYARSSEPVFMREAAVLPPEAILDRAGIGWLLIREEMTSFTNAANLRPHSVVYADHGFQIHRRDPTPRYFFSSEYHVTDRATALKLIATAPSREIVLEAMPPFPPAVNGVDDPAPELISAKLNSLDLRIRAPRPGLLYIADAWDNGWSATVNGQPREILVANYAFRAIAVPAGEVRVKLSYLPIGFVPGAVISLLCLVAVITLAMRKSASPVLDVAPA